MPLEVHPCTPADLPDFVRIQTAAFSTGIASYLAPPAVTDEWIANRVAEHTKKMHSEPDALYMKVIDTDKAGKMIAGARWRFNERERTEEEIQGMLPVPGHEEEGRPAAQIFMEYLNNSRREYMGTKPFSFLHVLVTDPAEHRRGAGALLLKWGLEKADRAQLPSYLEASEMGKPLYARWGFEVIKEVVFDLTKYGGEGSDSNTVMIRQPRD